MGVLHMEKYSVINTYMKAILAFMLVASVIFICIRKEDISPLVALAGTAAGYYFGKQSNAASTDNTGTVNVVDMIANSDTK